MVSDALGAFNEALSTLTSSLPYCLAVVLPCCLNILSPCRLVTLLCILAPYFMNEIRKTDKPNLWRVGSIFHLNQ